MLRRLRPLAPDSSAGQLSPQLSTAVSVIAGLAMSGALAAGAFVLTDQWQVVIGAPAAAILLGALVAAAWRVPAVAMPGLDFAVRRLLRFAIVLLGARFGVAELFSVGSSSLIIILACLGVTLAVGGYLVTRMADGRVLATLIVLGTAICGNSAIVAAAPILRAPQRELAYAVVTITLLGLSAVLIYPIVGGFLQLDERTYGLWAGTAINDTSQVVAAGYGYGQQAGDTAAIVKLTRNLFIAPILIGLAVRHRTNTHSALWATARTAVPPFVVGFVGMAAARSLGILEATVGPAALHEWAAIGSSALMLVALSAVGLQTRMDALRKSGLSPLRMGVLLSITLAIVSLAIATSGLVS